MLVPALAGVLVLGCQSGGDGGPPTAEEAHRFVEAAESRLKTLGNNASRAGWVQSNFITVDTQQIAADAQSELAAAVSELARGARRFEQLQLPYDDARKLKLLKLLLAAPAPDNKAERDELSNLSSSLEGDYGKGKYCRDVKGKQECLDINGASNILSSSRDPKELARRLAGLARGRRAHARSVHPLRRAVQQRRARVGIRRCGRAVALVLRHAAGRVRGRGRSTVGAGAAALSGTAHLRAIEAG